MAPGIRQKLGAIGFDLPPFEWRLRRNWTHVRNRSESLESAPDGVGVRCLWEWTSDLHLAKVFPSTGRRLLERALGDWPIRFADEPCSSMTVPDVSIVIGHRGRARLPHLLATLRTIAAQKAVSCECIVVEQFEEPESRPLLPSWVRYLHTRPPETGMPYCRSWALNAGARIAGGALLAFHDNDMLVPERYACELWRRFSQGFDVINLKRFIFYLDRPETGRFFERAGLDPCAKSESVVQNLEAGGSVAVGREAFFALGGFDEAFVGWGGEDNEFWERAQTRKTWPYGYLPIVHLWHDAQPRKMDRLNPGLQRYAARSALPVAQRIEELRSLEFGRPDRLSGCAASP